MQITQDELLEALRNAMQTQEEGSGETGMTVNELCEKLQKGSEHVRRGIKSLIAAGKCEVVRVQRMDMTNRMVWVPGYRFKA